MSRRLFTVIVMALVMGLVFGGLRVASAEASAAQFGRTVQLANLTGKLTNLVDDLQSERDQTLVVFNSANPQVPLAPFDRKTDSAIVAVRQAAGGIGGGFGANIQGDLTTVLADLGPQRMRNLHTILSTPQSAFAVINDYGAVITDVINLAAQVAQGVPDVPLVNDVQALNSLALAKEQVSRQRALLTSSIANPTNASGSPATAPNLAVVDPNTKTQLQIASQEELADEARFQNTATPAELLQLSHALKAKGEAASVAVAREMENAVFAGDSAGGNQLIGTTNGPGGTVTGSLPNAVIPDINDPLQNIDTLPAALSAWDTGMTGVIGSMQAVETQIAGNILARAQQLQSGAKQTALVTLVVTLVVLFVVLLAALLVARSLVRPLRRLRASALNIATVQLPERVRQLSVNPEEAANLQVQPIKVLSTDEVGQVARAFDQVHAEAVRLAGEEAILRASFNAMFVNLSRRSQSLIERLARMIDGLEQSEEDPDRLSGLFSMDHLVTRMRRNSENLLLLAGHENPRKWSESVPLADVARAATSEIEQYNRVTLNFASGVAIVGAAVSDVVHLLAELIENATIFSPKDTQVLVNAQELSSGGVLIEVTDKGIGVSEERLADMNWRLDNPPVMDVSVSRHMGLFAVARLAERHRVRVRLRPANPQGLTALVWLPDSVIERTNRLTGGFSAQPAAVGARRVPGQSGMGRRAISNAPDDRGYGNGGGVAVAQGGGPQQSRRSSGWFRGRSGTPAEPGSGNRNGNGNGNGFGGNGWGNGRNPAEVIAQPSYSEQTQAGLPLRTPKANLIPGSAVGAQPAPGRGGGQPAAPGGSGGPLPGSQPPMPARSPDGARSRLGGFQRGTRRAEDQAGKRPRAGEGSER